MSKMSRRIVVDASVARAAGTTENPVSVRSREFLLTMLDGCHRVVMTPEVGREWQQHQSNFTATWLGAMRRRRKVVSAEVDRHRQDALLAAIRDSNLGAKQQAETEKDCLLVSAAWATDGLVASNDGKVRTYLSRLATTSRDLARIVWVNPTEPDEAAVPWLAAGARTEPGRQLGPHRASRAERPGPD